MGLFNFFKNKAAKTNNTSRKDIPDDVINSMQQQPASDKYIKLLSDLYFKDYPEMPFISKDRELNANWIEQAEMFPDTVLKPDKMKRFPDGLLPGHVYLIHWLGKRNGKPIPAYFEYEYGINAHKEKDLLQEHKYLDFNYNPTQKGVEAVKKHYDVILEKEPPITVVTLNSGTWEDRYFTNMQAVQNLWSLVSKSKDYKGQNANNLEKLCIQNFNEYKEMIKAGIWAEDPPRNIPALMRLAMLYEKQARYDEAYSVVENAIKYGMESETFRLERLSKKINK